MPGKFLLTMQLTKQGSVKGSSTKKEGDLNFKDGMECHGFHYPVETQVNSNSGRPVGKRQHGGGDINYSHGMVGHGFDYGVTTPIDSNPGKPIRKLQRGMIIIRKEVDAASPKLLQALSTNETFRNATLQFNKTSPDGKPVVYHTIELTNGTVCGYRTFMGDSGKQCEDVILRYENLFRR